MVGETRKLVVSIHLVRGEFFYLSLFIFYFWFGLVWFGFCGIGEYFGGFFLITAEGEGGGRER